MIHKRVFFFMRNYVCTGKAVKYLIPALTVFVFTSCSGGGKAGVYDLPPTPPIPPEKFCFEQKDGAGKNTGSVSLIIAGDSVFGSIEYAPSENLPAENFLGTIYGNALLVKSTLVTNSKVVTGEREWKIIKDILYVPVTKQLPDSAGAVGKPKDQPTTTLQFYKITCL